MSATTTGSHSSFRPLQTINEERSTHGLRYGDYPRYRKHCAHKTHRLRSSLKLTHGKGREFKKLPPITAENSKDGHLHLLLFETERAWAHSQELSAPQDSRRSTSRYRRSHTYLSQLLDLARSPALPSPLTAQSTIELLVYALIHTARLNLRRSSASTAAYFGLEHHTKTEQETDGDYASTHPVVQLSVAHALLDLLEKTAKTSKEVALARAFKDDIGPEIRWCVHEFSRGTDEGEDPELQGRVAKWKPREWDIEGIVADIAPAYAEQVVRGYAKLVSALKADAGAGASNAGKREVLEELLWEGEPVPVRNPELVDTLLKVQDALAKLNVDAQDEEPGAKAVKAKGARGRIAKYDGVLLSLSDAADQARKLVEAQQVSGASSATAPGTRDIHFMHAYLTYLHLTYRIERDRLLLSALAAQAPTTATQSTRARKTTASTLHLLAGILQYLAQALTLPITDESPALAAALAARLAHAKAQRTLHLARAYAHPAHKKYAEALALAQRGHLHLREARAAHTAPEPHLRFYPLDATALDALAAELAAEETRFKVEWFAHNGGGAEGAAEKHRKPLFFDIAFNYVEPPVDRLRVRAGLAPREDTSAAGGKAKAEKEEEEPVEEVEEAPAPRGGLTGFLGSWWGRK